MACTMIMLCAGCTLGDTDKTEKQLPLPGKIDREIKEDKTVLEFYSWENEREIITALANQYMIDNPEIIINLHFIPVSEYGQKLSIITNGTDKIDGFNAPTPSVLAIYVNKGQVLSLDPFMEETDTDVSGYKDLLNKLKIAGKVYALPYRMSSWAVYYNKKIFDQAGVLYPEKDWTWEEYADTAVKLTSGKGAEKIYGSLNFEPTNNWWRIPARTLGMDNPLDENGLKALKRAAKWSYDLTYVRGAQPPYTDRTGISGADYEGAFLNGNIGMYFCGDWSVAALNSAIRSRNLDIDYDIAPLPHWKGEKNVSVGFVTTLQVAKKSEHPEEAYKFIEYACGEKGAQVMAKISYLPAWHSNTAINLYKKNITMPEHIEYLMIQDDSYQVPTDERYDEALEIVKDNVALYLLQEQDIDTTFENIKQSLSEAGLFMD